MLAERVIGGLRFLYSPPSSQDLQEVPLPSLQKALVTFVASKGTVLVGYGLKTDLLALGFAKDSPHLRAGIDLKYVQLLLESRRIQELPRPFGSGLAPLVDCYLGVPLDKAQQCSDWGARPLSEDQKRYAAADAACLLELLQAMISWHTSGEPDLYGAATSSRDTAWPGMSPSAVSRVTAEWRQCCAQVIQLLKDEAQKKKKVNPRQLFEGLSTRSCP